MMLPLTTAFAVSQSKVRDTFGESFSSIKDVHFLIKNLLNSVSFRNDKLNCHLVGGLGFLAYIRLKLIGAWSDVAIG